MARSKRLLRYLQPYAPHFAGSFAASTGASVLDGMSFALLIPFLRVLFGATPLPTSDGSAIDGILETLFGRVLQPEDPVAALQASVILIFLVVLFKNLMGYIAAYLAAYLEEGVARDLRLALYSHVIRLPLSTLDRRKGGDLVTRMLADADQAKGFISHTLASVLRNAILISVYLVILFALSWELTLATLVIGPVIALLVAPLTSRMRRQLKTALDSRGELTARMVEALSGARLVKAYRGESYEEERFARAAQGYFKGIVRTQRYAVAASPLSESLGAAAVVILMLTASWVAAGDSAFMRPELFVTFVAVTIRLLPPIKSLSQFPAYAEL
ncbi:MAG: ABC transporter transmembrane domain-containing protein, partial [Gemmatimonadales bacterium]